MSIIVGLTKMIYFAKLANLARIHQSSGKRLNETTKEAYWQLAIFTKMTIGEKGKNPSKVLQNLK